MSINDNPPNVRRIETDREGAYGFEITGHLTAPDVENLYGLLQGAYTLQDKIDVIVVAHDLEGFDWSTTLKDSTLLGKTRALKHIRKYAIVGGPSWMGNLMTVFRPFVSMEMRHFEADEEDEAWDWIGARPARRR